MTSQSRIRTQIGFAAGLLFVTAFAVAGNSFTQAVQISGKVTLKQADGTVTVDGRPAAKGDEIASGATVQTAKGSSAVVSLGKLGRVEVVEETTMKLTYTDSGFAVAMLSQGRVRVSSSSGVVTTGDGQITTVGRPRTDFLVDTTCGNTFVAVKVGRVELRAGSSVKQIAAGGQDTAGTATPGCTPGQ